MRLEDVTAEIRPRTPWESIDLGCALARRHFGAVLRAWGVTVVPLWIVLALLLKNHPSMFIFFVRWLKPIYDRVPLLVLSRALFGAKPSTLEVAKAWPKVMMRRLWFALFIGRFSPSRSLSLPVSELEGLSGKAYRQRVKLLERNGGEGATKATLVAGLLELVAGLGLVMLAMMMVPDQVSDRWFSGIGDYFNYHEVTDIPAGFYWLMSLVYMASIVLMEPFYVAAGFALYINSRTLTEGWDIELAFKRMSERLGKVTRSGSSLILLVIAVFSMTFWSGDVMAEETSNPPETHDVSKERIQEIVSHEDFTVHHRYVDVPVEKKGEKSWLWDFLFSDSKMPSFMGTLGKVVFYCAVLALLVGLAVLIAKNRWAFALWKRRVKAPPLPKTTSVMGMEVSPESLPDDVVESVRSAWQNGDVSLALGLLYRGAIAALIYNEQVLIEASDTEGDCLARVREHSNPEIVRYFSDLTQIWTAFAYGGNVPEEGEFCALCDRWPFEVDSSRRGVQPERRDA